jgi:hypothetical protein
MPEPVLNTTWFAPVVAVVSAAPLGPVSKSNVVSVTTASSPYMMV